MPDYITHHDPVQRFLAKLPDAKRQGPGHIAKCPAHADSRASLSINTGDDGRCLIKCFAGCTAESITSAVGSTLADLMPPRTGTAPKRQATTSNPKTFPTAEAALAIYSAKLGAPIATYPYQNADGKHISTIARYDTPTGKEIRPVSLNCRGWLLTQPPSPRPLYRLPELLAAPIETDVYIGEGEKCADIGNEIGLLMTTSAGGSQAATKSDWTVLKDRNAVVLPDNDEPGEKYAADVVRLANEAGAASVRILRFPGLDEGGDLFDLVQARREQGATDADIREEIERMTAEAEVVTVDADPDVDDWESPLPLTVGNLPTFPIEKMPRQLIGLIGFISEVSESLQVPIDLPAMLALGNASALLAKRVEVRVRGDFVEPVNLSVVPLLPPASRKSKTFSVMSRPIVDIERRETARMASIIADARLEIDILEKELGQLKQTAAKGGDKANEARARAKEIAQMLATSKPPVAPRFFLDDATQESIAREMFEQGGRIAIMSPEGEIFDIMTGRYSEGCNLGVFLKGHAGDPIRVNRVSKDRPPEHISKSALTMVVTAQPSVLPGLLKKKEMSGRGMLARLLWIMPDSRIGLRKVGTAAISQDKIDGYSRLMEGLFLPPRYDSEGELVPITLELSSQAAMVFLDFEKETEKALFQDGNLSIIQSWGGKLCGAVARITGILHCLIHAGRGEFRTPINVETIEAAIAIGRYLTEHAKAVFREMGADPSVEFARQILKWIADAGITEFTRKDAFLRFKTTLERVDNVDAPLRLLVNHEYIREQTGQSTGKAGRPPSPVFKVNPLGIKSKQSKKPPVNGDTRPEWGQI